MIRNYSNMLHDKYGEPGSPEFQAFTEEAHAFCEVQTEGDVRPVASI